MEKLTIDDYVINDYHVNKHFGLGDFAENGAYVKDEDFRYFPNAKLYKERYIQDKKVKDKKKGKAKKECKKKECKKKECATFDELFHSELRSRFDMIATNLSGKSFTVEDIVRLFHRENFISWSEFTNITVLQDGVCGGKTCCIRVSYKGKEYILKEMGESMNYGNHYIAVDECKSLFGLRDMNMKIITSDQDCLKKIRNV